MTRDDARRLSFPKRWRLGAVLVVGGVIGAGAVPACYSAGAGTSPPPDTFYFPVGLAVSAGGHVLYAVNSDFDLQWNGGTLQSYDLAGIRRDAATLIGVNENSPGSDGGALADGGWPNGAEPGFFQRWRVGCLTAPLSMSANSVVPLGQACAPPVDSSLYFKDGAVIGAFATDLVIESPDVTGTGPTRLFVPVGGDATVTWADLPYDAPIQSGAPNFTIDCGQASDAAGRCDAAHHAGDDPNQPLNNSRHATLPGEPFGMALTEDGTAMAVTHQATAETSLLLSGFHAPPPGGAPGLPSMQFVLEGVPNGGNGIAAIPHDPDASIKPCPVLPPTILASTVPCVRPAFLETNYSTPEVDLLRYYTDDGSSLGRPYLTREAFYSLTVNQVGTDSRGIVIDPSPRLACKARATPPGGVISPADLIACAQIPARVFFANRSPPSLVVGEIGEPSASGDGTYDPDFLKILTSVPVLDGPSRVYLAPVIDTSGRLALRVFVVCFDAGAIQVFDPNDPNLANVDTIYVGPGPFGMAFDPFSLDDVVKSSVNGDTSILELNRDPVIPTPALNRYRFGYIASFTQSFVQMIDLDARQPTFENIVYQLGNPTPPKGT